jgi:hypothetical protein
MGRDIWEVRATGDILMVAYWPDGGIGRRKSVPPSATLASKVQAGGSYRNIEEAESLRARLDMSLVIRSLLWDRRQDIGGNPLKASTELPSVINLLQESHPGDYIVAT